MISIPQQERALDWVTEAIRKDMEMTIREVTAEEIARAQTDAAERIETRLKLQVAKIAVAVHKRFSARLVGGNIEISIRAEDLFPDKRT